MPLEVCASPFPAAVKLTMSDKMMRLMALKKVLSRAFPITFHAPRKPRRCPDLYQHFSFVVIACPGSST